MAPFPLSPLRTGRDTFASSGSPVIPFQELLVILPLWIATWHSRHTTSVFLFAGVLYNSLVSFLYSAISKSRSGPASRRSIFLLKFARFRSIAWYAGVVLYGVLTGASRIANG